MDLRILELFSGIGGMHFAFQYSKVPGEIVAAMDINTVANRVYAHNFPQTALKNNNIQSLDAKTIEKLKVNTILMSPPCQPHTRIGNQLDIEDKRSDALQHICSLLPQCTDINYILMENVKGFEKSKARQCFVAVLESTGFNYCEFILSPTQFGVPNTRYRYYCLARKNNNFNFSTEDQPLEKIPTSMRIESIIELKLKDILEPESVVLNDFLVNDTNLIKRVLLMDIVTADDKNTMCFTKAYTHYAEGTGSVFSPLERSGVDNIFEILKTLENSPLLDEQLMILKKLHLRYFTPREVARLMLFPESFAFPIGITNRQKYRLLGNSINIMVVGELIKLLCNKCD